MIIHYTCIELVADNDTAWIIIIILPLYAYAYTLYSEFAEV